MIDSLTLIFEDICLYSYSLANNARQLVSRFLSNTQVSELIETANDKLNDYPVLRFAVFGAAISFIVPIVLFVLFAIVSVVITFAGFVLIEGIILALGGICLCVCLISIAMIMSVLAVLLGFCHIMASKLQLC